MKILYETSEKRINDECYFLIKNEEHDSHLKNSHEIEHGIHTQRISIDEFDPYSKKTTLHNSETNDSAVHDFEFVEKNELLSEQPTSDKSHNNNETMPQNFQYKRSLSENARNTEQESKDFQNNQMLLFSATNESEKRTPKSNDHSPVSSES
jgi:hypothetical protein